MNIEKLISNLRGIDIKVILEETVKEESDNIKSLIHVQLKQGYRGDGQLISPQYSKAYEKKKGRSVPDLKVSGQFWSDITPNYDDGIINVSADTRTRKGFELAEHLEKRYTSKIYELTPASTKKEGERFTKTFFKKLSDEIWK